MAAKLGKSDKVVVITGRSENNAAGMVKIISLAPEVL